MYNPDRKQTEDAIMRYMVTFRYELLKLKEDSELSDDEEYKEVIKQAYERFMKQADEMEEKLHEVIKVI
ncbi:MAG: hypothetical protein IKV89_04435 [Clostridia bacterium]|nr:hypothetical protein [Clostridia bacterium]